MKSLLLITALTLFCFEGNSQTLRQTLLRQDSSLKDVIVIKCKTKADLFITILVKQKDWWEDIELVSFSKGHILWTAKFDTLPSSQSILSARQISLKGISLPLIEVFDVTHQGNGYYYLYEIKGKHARLITQTRAVDWNFEEALEFNHKFNCSIIYKGGKLTPFYRDVNNDGITDIILKGTIQIFESDWKTKLKEYPAQKVLIFNKAKKKFVEDLRQRKGFDKDDD
jgi:hypothetical protein